MDVFKTTAHMVQVKLKTLQVDVISEKINDCFEILVLIAQMWQGIHWPMRQRIDFLT